LEKDNWISIDESDNLYVTGGYWETVDFDPGPGTVELEEIFHELPAAEGGAIAEVPNPTAQVGGQGQPSLPARYRRSCLGTGHGCTRPPPPGR